MLLRMSSRLWGSIRLAGYRALGSNSPLLLEGSARGVMVGEPLALGWILVLHVAWSVDIVNQLRLARRHAHELGLRGSLRLSHVLGRLLLVLLLRGILRVAIVTLVGREAEQRITESGFPTNWGQPYKGSLSLRGSVRILLRRGLLMVEVSIMRIVGMLRVIIICGRESW